MFILHNPGPYPTYNNTGIRHNGGLVQDGSNSIANALELLQSCTKPSICLYE